MGSLVSQLPFDTRSVHGQIEVIRKKVTQVMVNSGLVGGRLPSWLSAPAWPVLDSASDSMSGSGQTKRKRHSALSLVAGVCGMLILVCCEYVSWRLATLLCSTAPGVFQGDARCVLE